MGKTSYAFESNPELLWASLIGAAATAALFWILHRNREMRERLMPLCVLTLLHTLVFPLVCCFPYHSEYTERTVSDHIVENLAFAHVLFVPALLLFLVFYVLPLVICSHRDRPIWLAAGVFFLNVLIQVFFTLYALGSMFTR